MPAGGRYVPHGPRLANLAAIASRLGAGWTTCKIFSRLGNKAGTAWLYM